jgi:hypothetical protein
MMERVVNGASSDLRLYYDVVFAVLHVNDILQEERLVLVFEVGDTYIALSESTLGCKYRSV